MTLLRLLLQLSKMRIRNVYEVVSTENLEEIQSEYILSLATRSLFSQLFSEDSEKDQDEDEHFSQASSQNYLYCDFESKYLDLCFVALNSVLLTLRENRGAVKKLGLNPLELLKRVKHLAVGEQEETFLFEIVDQEAPEPESGEGDENDIVMQSSLVKRAAVSSVRLNLSYLRRKCLNCKKLKSIFWKEKENSLMDLFFLKNEK